MQKSRWIALIVVVIVTTSLFLWWPRKVEILPVDFSLFMETVTFIRHENEQPIGDVVELPVNTGFYADLIFTTQESYPEQYGDLEVQPLEQWPVKVEIFHQTDTKKKTVIQLPFRQYSLKRRRISGKQASLRTRSVPVAGSGQWSEMVGYNGVPEAKSDSSSENEQRFWTYFTSGRNRPPGDYIFEISIHPTAVWTSSVRATRGEPFVIKRGILHIYDENSK